MAGAAFAHVNNTTTRSNTQHNGTAPVSQSCPTGQSWDATTKKCVATDSINYNASKSNTRNVAARGPTPTAPPAAPK
jgi:hypothetical protein